MAKKLKATDVSLKAFGGILESDNNGFYTSLEFFYLARASIEAYGTALPDRPSVTLSRNTHDAARRLAWSPSTHASPADQCIDEMEASKRRALAAIIAALKAPVPGRTKTDKWDNCHLLPYTLSIPHFDGKDRKGKGIGSEVVYYRGAGSLAFKTLRSDADASRRKKIAAGLESVLAPRDGDFLQALFETLGKYDEASREPAAIDAEERASVREDHADEALRNGCRNILSHNIPRVAKVNALLHFIPFAIAASQFQRAAESQRATGEMPFTLGPLDFGTEANQVRRLASRSYKNTVNEIDRQLEGAAGELGVEANLTSIRSYFTRTAGAIGLANSPGGGKKHFTLRDKLLEALLLATTCSSHPELSVTDFCREISDTWGLAIDRPSAERLGLLGSIDGAEFEDNADQLIFKLRQLGFLNEYGDQTKMVRYGT